MKDFKESLRQNLHTGTIEEKNEEIKETTCENTPIFKIARKQDDKTNKKIISLHMEHNLVRELDKICKRTGHSRNELINLMCDFCINNIEIE